jgi:hypothetical protein
MITITSLKNIPLVSPFYQSNFLDAGGLSRNVIIILLGNIAGAKL